MDTDVKLPLGHIRASGNVWLLHASNVKRSHRLRRQCEKPPRPLRGLSSLDTLSKLACYHR